MTVQVRRCSHADLAVLRRRWPLVVGVHEAHLVQGDYLVAWDGDEPLGSGVLRWAGSIGDHARAVAGRAPALVHLHVRDIYRGRGIRTALLRSLNETSARPE